MMTPERSNNRAEIEGRVGVSKTDHHQNGEQNAKSKKFSRATRFPLAFVVVGNAAFKSGDYPTAIEHYSAAIIEDRNDPKFPLNRAAAYLKLGKNEGAESDCTTALTLSPLNVKGIFRRGQARLGMGKLDGAKGDFEAATKIEPGNQAVEDELEKIHVLAQKNFKKASKTTAQSFGSSAALDPRRRRVQILIIEASQGASSVSQGTTTSAVQESSPVPPAPAPALSTTSTATDSPTATVATPPKTLPGCHTRTLGDETIHSCRRGYTSCFGQNTLFNSKESSMSSSPPAPSTNLKTSANLHEFTKAWGSSERFQLIKDVGPSTYPSLEPLLLILTVQTFLDILTSDSHSDAKSLATRSMEGFLHVPRVSNIALFLGGT
ncbi:rna polymerase ii-associated protein 3 [Moniliophthora roreri MCA 2997]|uniref:Rna polymerase ii-associated protein 3 n=1 Tax=Moniliophthora roreri (strain MCA 2997) TaxID=1381753 RepID=V2WD96_MONRO|nr:rna polymerase ii-associated protein 3 [Moniliophthora roreri MCA 2997]